MQCPRCGFDNKPKSKFCNLCGFDLPKKGSPAYIAPSVQSSRPSYPTPAGAPVPAGSGFPARGPVYERAPFYKQLWFWMLLVIAAIGVVVYVFDPFDFTAGAPWDSDNLPLSSELAQSEDASSQVLGADLGQSVAPELPQESAPTAAGDGRPPETGIEALRLTLLNFGAEQVDITFDAPSNTFHVDLASAGLVDEVALAAEGDEKLREDWEEVKTSIVFICDNAKSALVNEGFATASVAVRVVNDLNSENTLLLVVNGVVQYDVLAG